jgi:hypothetical protein
VTKAKIDDVGLVTQPMWDVDKMEASPENTIYDNPDDAYADIKEDIKEHGITTPLLIRVVGLIAVIICGHRRWAVAKLLGLKQVPVTIISDSYDHLATKQKLVTDNLITRPKLPWAEFGECFILLGVQEDRALIRKGEAARRTNELLSKGQITLRENSPRASSEDTGRARDLTAAILNTNRIGKPITGETVEMKAGVYQAFLNAKEAGDLTKAKKIMDAGNKGNLSAAIRETKKAPKENIRKLPATDLDNANRLGKPLRPVLCKLGKSEVKDWFLAFFGVKLSDKQVTQVLEGARQEEEPVS